MTLKIIFNQARTAHLFATVGADDCWDIVYDNQRPRETWLGRQRVERLGVKAEELPTVVAGLGGTPIPRPERMYFRFLQPVRPGAFRGLPPATAVRAMRDHVEGSVHRAIDELLAYRERDERRALGARVFDRMSNRPVRQRTP